MKPYNCKNCGQLVQLNETHTYRHCAKYKASRIYLSIPYDSWRKLYENGLLSEKGKDWFLQKLLSQSQDSKKEVKKND